MKKAFTLAEVLITLGIVGIVAAMTIPALIGKHKKIETVTKLKTAYATINNAFKLAVANYGDMRNWDYIDNFDQPEARKAFIDKYTKWGKESQYIAKVQNELGVKNYIWIEDNF